MRRRAYTPKPHKWTEAENEFVRRHYRSKGSSWVAKKLNMTQCMILGKARKLGLQRKAQERLNAVV